MTLRLRILNAALRLGAKPLLRQLHVVLRARPILDRLAPLAFRAPPLSLFLPAQLTDDLSALWISNRPASHPPDPGKVILYLHGGGYIAGSAQTHQHMLARLSRLTRLRICAPSYRLAPEHPFPAAFEDAEAAFDALCARGYRSCDITVGGDSAGGGLALALMARLVEQGRPPRAVFAFSPLTDFQFQGQSFTDNARIDPLLPAEQADLIAQWYLNGHAAGDPRASPLHATFDTPPPPVFLQFSNSEILRDDSRRMAARLAAAGGEVTQDEWQGTPHVWAFFDSILPEARQGLQRVADFIGGLLVLDNLSE